jgi:hypothetical protein
MLEHVRFELFVLNWLSLGSSGGFVRLPYKSVCTFRTGL